MKKTKIINMFGAPGAGKSTAAAYVFSMLKMNGIDAELVTEFAKDKVWEQNPTPFKHQVYMFGKQAYRIEICVGKVDVIVTDSPLPLSIIYNHDIIPPDNFNGTVMDVYNMYDNINYFLKRGKAYNPNGRNQTEEESDALSVDILNLLNKFNIRYKTYYGIKEDYDKIVSEVMDVIKGE
jgi:hypothetical protein